MRGKIDNLQQAQSTTEDQYEGVLSNLSEIEDSYKNYASQSKSLVTEMRLLRAVVIKQASEIAELKAKVTDLQTRSMSKNVIFHNVPESQKEDCYEKVSQLLKDTAFHGDVKFDSIHRLAQLQRALPIVASVQSKKQASALFGFGANLAKEKKGDNPLRITPQYSPEVREKKEQLGEVAAKFREKDRSAVTKIVAGNL